ncbi:hypothetical protein A9Q83_06615 [Alphaproteobacteria bacterium 46_93_T64]|nr:hypothetical protein A9Q83_06615 [Alphaproteobacteria bacterium 46_93_T64]
MSDDADDAMPMPADLSALYQDHSKKLKDAYAESSAAFNVFKERDAQIGALSRAYQEEMVKVFTIAKAVSNPPTAIASVPVILALANETFAKAPITEAALTSMIEGTFAPFK